MQKIVFVSRLDADCSLGAYILCAIAPRLVEKYKDLEIILVGGGTEFQKIRKMSCEINTKINPRLIKAVGNVENPSVYFEKSSLFVGVSRAALEAMAHGLPVVLFGNEGQLGLLDEKKLSFAKRTNFTCRGVLSKTSGEIQERFLFDEICRYFDMTREEKQRLSSLSRATVEKYYSAHKMAQNTLEIYHKSIENIQKHAKKIAICGYYGRGNLGDEAILSAICQNFAKNNPNSQISVIKNKNPIHILRALYGADCFVFGGGSLLQNSTSNVSLLYYFVMISVAKILCKRQIMLANGIGPIVGSERVRKLLNEMVASVVNTFDFISVRDTISQNLLKEILPNRKIHLIPDPALLCIKIEEKAQKSAKKMPKKEKKSACFVYIPCSNGLKKSKISPQTVATSITKIEKAHGLPPVVAVLNEKEDLALARKVAKLLGGAQIVLPKTPRELLEVFSTAKFVISQRYHGSLFAAIECKPILSVSNDPKMRALCGDFSLFLCQKTSIFNNDCEFDYKIKRALEHQNKNRATIRKKVVINEKICRKMMKDLLR